MRTYAGLMLNSSKMLEIRARQTNIRFSANVATACGWQMRIHFFHHPVETVWPLNFVGDPHDTRANLMRKICYFRVFITKAWNHCKSAYRGLADILWPVWLVTSRAGHECQNRNSSAHRGLGAVHGCLYPSISCAAISLLYSILFRDATLFESFLYWKKTRWVPSKTLSLPP